MPSYKATCIHKTTGRRFSGLFSADSLAHLKAQVNARDAFLTDYKEVQQNAGSRRIKISLKNQVHLFNLLCLQMRHGISAEDAVATLTREFPAGNVGCNTNRGQES